MSRFRTPSKGVGFPDAHDNCIIPNNSKDFWHVSNEALLSAITTQTEATSIVFFVTHRNVRTNCTFEFLYAVAWQTDRRSALYYTLRARKTPIRRFFCWYIVGGYQAWAWMKRAASQRIRHGAVVLARRKNYADHIHIPVTVKSHTETFVQRRTTG